MLETLLPGNTGAKIDTLSTSGNLIEAVKAIEETSRVR